MEENKLRRAPKQKRAKSLIDDVLEASARLIPTYGYDKATTNKIAELAGVSIGSLYQYFPNKNAIFVSLIEKIENNHCQQLRDALYQARDLPLPERVEPVIAAIVDLVMEKRKLLLILYTHAPQLGLLGYLAKSRQNFRKEIEPVLQEYAEHMQISNTQISARLVVSSVYGILEDLIQSDSDEFDLDQIKIEIALLVRAYLFQRA